MKEVIWGIEPAKFIIFPAVMILLFILLLSAIF